jgi:hypothetical protein
MGQRTDRIFGAKPGIIGKSAPILAEITIRKSQDIDNQWLSTGGSAEDVLFIGNTTVPAIRLPLLCNKVFDFCRHAVSGALEASKMSQKTFSQTPHNLL